MYPPHTHFLSGSPMTSNESLWQPLGSHAGIHGISNISDIAAGLFTTDSKRADTELDQNVEAAFTLT